MEIHKRFGRLLFLTAAATILVGAAIADETAPKEPQAGSDYILVEPPQPMRVAAGKLEIREFFNFSCPHCFRLQGPFSRWRNESSLSDIVIIHQPVVFDRYHGHYARAYYTMEALGLTKEYYGKMFTAIHRNRKLLNSKGRFINWLEEEAGADSDTAEKVYDSFTVNTKTARAADAAAVYGIDSTPQFVVAGKYILNLSISGSYDRLFATLTALLEKERQSL